VKGKLLIRNHLIYSILLPVLGMGMVISLFLVAYSLPPLLGLFTRYVDADLRLASQLGVGICENSFNYLLELRLEDDPEMNASLRREAIEEIKGLHRSFRGLHLLVVEGRDRPLGSSAAMPEGLRLPGEGAPSDAILAQHLGGRPVRLHQRFFPFWNWHIVSYISEEDYQAPNRLLQRTIYLGSLMGLVMIVATFFAAFKLFVDRPLRRVIEATRGIADGRFQRLPTERHDEIGQLVQSFNAMVDSLERKETDVHNLLEALRTSEDRFRTLFESSPLGIGLADRHERLWECNEAMLQLLGCPRAAISHVTLPSLFQNTEEGVRLLRKLDAGQVLRNFDAELRRTDGRPYSARLTASRFRLGSETVTLVLCEDVTKERQLEARLQRAQKMEAIGTLAGGVAHDLNNILSGIVSYPELLLMDLPADSPLVGPVQTIRQSGEKAAAIVQDLLTLARRGVAVTEVVNLNRIVGDYLRNPEHAKLLRFHADVRVDARLADDLFNVMGSPVHLSKTLMNLVSNAAEAMPGGGTIVIATENRYVDHPIGEYDHVEEGDYAVLTVSDTGEGIAPEDRERIFEPFFTKKVMGRSGTGLGMAVVWGTVKDHRGYIDLQSTEGRGTTFSLYFPVTREAVRPETARFSMADYRARGERILVVDDVPEQRQLAASMLTRLGYHVATAASGEEAEAYLREQSVDLVVLDMIMDPGIDGLETYRRLRAIRRQQRAVIASGFSETGRVRAAQALGAGAYVKKPYTLEILAKTVRAELDRSGVSEEERPS
jgi:two-component system cell cycle sensor histidine kinase/response regulator CckA